MVDQGKTGGGRSLVISGHDYRSMRKAGVHFISNELSKQEKVRFFSIGFSYLSRIKKDPRLNLWDRANRLEIKDGVECYLWRSLVHPFNMHRPAMLPAEKLFFEIYARSVPAIFKQWVVESDTIFIESGLGIALFDQVKAINPKARLIYLCSDMLETIDVSHVLREKLSKVQYDFDAIRLPSVGMLSEYPDNPKVRLIPHGLEMPACEGLANPFTAPCNVVSVGSMLFDADAFAMAARLFPDVHFHAIGAGAGADRLSGPNITVHAEMPFLDTWPYLVHADAGFAPYRAEGVTPYLADSSLKLAQFGALGLPAICPTTVTGGRAHRFGYTPGDEGTMRAALEAALAYGRFEPVRPWNWSEVVERIVAKESFADTIVERKQAA